MKLKYVIPIVANPYNGNRENEKICVYENCSSPWLNVISSVADSVTADSATTDDISKSLHIEIRPDFDNFSKKSQRFMLMLATATTCFDLGLSKSDFNTCGIDTKAHEMSLPDLMKRIVSVHTLHRMITLYGIRAMDSVIDELYHSDPPVINNTTRQDYKDIINMYIYGMPRDVLDLGTKISSINNAKFNLDDIDIMFVCNDGKFDIATMKCERF